MIVDRRSMLAGAAALAALPTAALRAQTGRIYRNSIALDGTRVWMAAKIGTHGPYFFIVDTGATLSVIDDDLARTLKLDVIRKRALVKGIGGVAEYPLYDARDVTFASGLRIPNMPFNGTKARLGKDAVGSFGSGLFTTYDSDLDFVKGEWRAYPEGRPDFAGLRQLKSRFLGSFTNGDRIFADATLDGFAGEFMLDTGMPGQVRLDGRAAKTSGLWSADRPYAPTEGRGFGPGSVSMRLVRVKDLHLGPMTLHRPIVALEKPGSPLHEGDGIIGLGVLGRLHLTTQVRSRTLWIAPNGLPPRAEVYPMSGLWFDRKGDTITIADVGTGSPAAAAGLMVGDRIGGIAWSDLIRRVNGPAGSEVAFTAERGGQRRDVTLKLVDYL
ncbi:aspartyl protease family protein [Sphingomonas donggukensis]|uniref:Aspartyl protease family protein n=1 Tax=Sphingomonas donggukensis TaxID=2949093 RepID=A0ABY4TXW3_9SPHN|nr:aspartyl protease family protein [Sphingomonas donggukensis]URW76501.1 aspartyl protease family protein [Sphingomonas donggukensis]